MEEYYFLFALALIYTLFATIQDIRKTEVSNWLNFSLISFALAYRAIYSIFSNDGSFLIYGIAGFAVFFVLANAFYYTKVFAGGDAKLLMAYGAIMPFESMYDMMIVSMGFILVLFVCGAVYSLIYGFVLSLRRMKEVWKTMKEESKKNRFLIIMSLILASVLVIIGFGNSYSQNISIMAAVFLIFMSLLYVYLKAVEKVCFIKLVKPDNLTEGDWLERDVKLGRKMLRRSVHGLSFEDIKLLKKYKKKVWVKYGVPFVPAFLIALVVMVFFEVFSELDFGSLFSLF